MRAGAFAALLALALVSALSKQASALAPPPGLQSGHAASIAAPAPRARVAACKVGAPVVGPLVSEVTGAACGAAEGTAGLVSGLAGQAVSAVGGSILDVLADWMIGAATQITTFVARAMSQTTTPQLESAWFEAQFAPMANLGAGLGLLVALIAFASATIRRSPHALAHALAGIVRAGAGTGLIVALTVIGLSVADQISAAVLSGSPRAFWGEVAHAWGANGFGGFGSSALAMLIALVEVFAAVFVWLELIVRNAAIYVAVLLFPVALAAAIWPALGAWPARLGRLLLLFVILKPLTLIVLSLAGAAAAAGLSFGGGVQGSVGTILSAVVIFALAAFAPWALMHLLAADAESAHTASGLRSAAGAAVLDRGGRSVRSGGGLANSDAGGSAPPGSSPPGRPPRGRGPGGRGGGGPRHPLHAGSRGDGGGSSAPAESDALALGTELGAAGSVGAAAGMGVGARGRSSTAPDGRERERARGVSGRSRRDPHDGGDQSASPEGARVIALPPRDLGADDGIGKPDAPQTISHDPSAPIAFLKPRSPISDEPEQDPGA
jgi:hypothetical protein